MAKLLVTSIGHIIVEIMTDDFLIFEQRATAAHRRRAVRLDPGKRFLRDEIRRRLLERLGDVRQRFSGAILDLGSVDVAQDKASLTAALGGELPGPIVSFDLGAVVADGASVIGDAELLPFGGGSFDLVFSTLGLQSVNDLPGALAQIRFCLRPDGLFLGAVLGGRTLYELREVLMQAEIELAGGASPRISPFMDLRSGAGLLQRAGLALPVADLETITLTYPTMFTLTAELRALGETNGLRARLRRFTRRAIMLRAAELYAQKFADARGRIIATFDVVMMAGWSPAPSQPQPLKRGSASHRLSAALDDG
jgi:SAM-dependent methyltransferase